MERRKSGRKKEERTGEVGRKKRGEVESMK